MYLPLHEVELRAVEGKRVVVTKKLAVKKEVRVAQDAIDSRVPF